MKTVYGALLMALVLISGSFAWSVSDSQIQRLTRYEIFKASENSFLGPDFQPLAGTGVLLVAQIRPGLYPWNLVTARAVIVKFEIVSGTGYLQEAGDYPGKVPGFFGKKKSLKLPAFTNNSALAWLVTEPGHTDAVTIKVSLLPQDDPGPRLGAHREDFFVVQPILPPASWDLDVQKLAEAQLQNQELQTHLTSIDRTNYLGPVSEVMALSPKALLGKERNFVRNGEGFTEFQRYQKGKPNGPLGRTGWVRGSINPAAKQRFLNRFKGMVITHVNSKTEECAGVLLTQIGSSITINKYNLKYPGALASESMVLQPLAVGGLLKSQGLFSDPKVVKGFVYWGRHETPKSFDAFGNKIYDLMELELVSNVSLDGSVKGEPK